MSKSENQVRILVFGSCVSRDIFNFAADQQFELVDYYARSSLASVGATPVDTCEKDLAQIVSPFQRRMVLRDMSKGFLNDLKTLQFDVLLLDIIDERFDVYEIAPGSVVTLSNEFLASGLITTAERNSAKWIKSDSEQHRTLWLKGMERFFSELDILGLVNRIVVNRVFWANRFEDDAPLPATYPATTVEKANSHLAWMYEQLERFVAPSNWLHFSNSMLKANQQHRWGVSPFHYSDEYYRTAITALNDYVKQGIFSPSPSMLSAEDNKDSGNINLADYSIDKVDLNRDQDELVASVVSSGPSNAQFAFYVFRNEERVHSQWYGSTTVMRFDTKGESGLYRVFVFLLTPEGKKLTKYSNPVFLNPGIFTLDRPRMPTLEERVLQLHGSHWKFPALYFNSRDKRLFVMLTAAIDRTKHTLPVFNRWTWAEKFPGHVLCVADPTLELDGRMKLGWYLGTEMHDATAELCRLIHSFAKVLGIPDERIVFWGSSGGGFGALALASHLVGSTAVAINAQTDALAYHVDDDVEIVRDKCFGGQTETVIYNEFGARIDMKEAWSRVDRSRVILVQNKYDSHHYIDHFQPFWTALGGNPEGGRTADGRHYAWLYEDTRGHVPETEQMVPEILRLLDDSSYTATPVMPATGQPLTQ